MQGVNYTSICECNREPNLDSEVRNPISQVDINIIGGTVEATKRPIVVEALKHKLVIASTQTNSQTPLMHKINNLIPINSS